MGSINAFPYYPNYMILDNALLKADSKKMNVFIDLKNCMQTIYMKDFVEQMVDSSIKSRYMDPAIFFSVLEFISFMKTYGAKKNVEMNMYFFFERGDSMYHKSIANGYKANRKISGIIGLEEGYREAFAKVLNKNLDLIKKVCSRLPKVNVLELEYMEADFVPYYLMEYVMDDVDEFANIIFSTDKDHFQAINNKNKFQFIRMRKELTLLTHSTVFKKFFGKYYKEDLTMDPEYMALFLAIDGDVSDDFKGVPKVSKGTIFKCANEIVEAVGPMKELYHRIIQNDGPLIQEDFRTNNKQMTKIIDHSDTVIKNLKLASYYLLSDYLNETAETNVFDKKKYLQESTISKGPDLKPKVLKLSFENMGISMHITDNTISNLFL